MQICIDTDLCYIYDTYVYAAAAAAAKSRQLCLTLCDPIDCSPPGSSVPRILQARTLEWIAISFSNAWKWKVKVKLLSRVRVLATPWTVAYRAPLSMGFPRQEYLSNYKQIQIFYSFLSFFKDTTEIHISQFNQNGDLLCIS